MPGTAISIRPASPADADFLAWAILTATRSHLPKGWFDIVLDRTEREVLEFTRCLTGTHARSFWHSSHFLIAETASEAVAALSVFPARQAYSLYWDAIRQAANQLSWTDPEQDPMWKRGEYLQSCVLPPDEDPNVWAIENVATKPNLRRRGLARQLLESAMAEARRSGAHEIQITFLIGNEAAQAVYAEAGFNRKDEKRTLEFEAACGAPGLRRYSREL
jgi:ribosomal protein S18 acetylase RimI-like enzyme